MRVKLEQFFQDNRTYVGACASMPRSARPVALITNAVAVSVGQV